KICTKTVISVVIVVFVMTFVVGCSNQMHEKEEIFKSPTGKKEVIVKVDYVSRPDVFCDNECIFCMKEVGLTRPYIGMLNGYRKNK
ncbi:MAG: hypothetical protein IJ054_06795, partial [Lachnospiraceae bacterium]|nr:hypothetical protein [Lachnospiraceae bacterium]